MNPPTAVLTFDSWCNPLTPPGVRTPIASIDPGLPASQQGFSDCHVLPAAHFNTGKNVLFQAGGGCRYLLFYMAV